MTMQEFLLIRYDVRIVKDETLGNWVRRVLGREFCLDRQPYEPGMPSVYSWVRSDQEAALLQRDGERRVRAEGALARWSERMAKRVEEDDAITTEEAVSEELALTFLDEEMARAGFRIVGEPSVPLTDVEMFVPERGR